MRAIRFAAAAAACGLAAALAPLGASGSGKPSYGCPPGFNFGSVTFEDYLALPRTQAAIDAGLATTEDILASLAGVDANANGRICVQLSHGFEVTRGPFGVYYYNVAEDNASVP
jgi:hypothetical protein